MSGPTQNLSDVALPSWNLTELRRELLRLTSGPSRVMVIHLVDGLAEEFSRLTPREVLHELLTILLAVSQTLSASQPQNGPFSEGRPPMD